MLYTVSEVTQFIEENDVKFIRLAFCDLLGKQKNISIMPSELQKAFDHGIRFDTSAVEGFASCGANDLVLLPDPSTLSILPWRPSHGRVVRFFCDIKYEDGRPYEGDCRNLMRNAASQLEQLGYRCKIGTQCEFYLFELDEHGNPTRTPQDQAGYGDIAPKDKGENVRRAICLTLEEMGMQPESSHHERGPGQNEIDFKHSDALTAADHFLAFKGVVKTVAAQNGLYASFMPKPFYDKSGSGLHIHFSLHRWKPLAEGPFLTPNSLSESFAAGIMHHLRDLNLFLNPLCNSYRRFASDIPAHLAWSYENRSQIVRIKRAEEKNHRVELLSPDASVNPYLAFALLLSAGIDGINKNLTLPPQFDANKKDLLPTLCTSLEEALCTAENSAFLQDVLPDILRQEYLSIKRRELAALKSSADQDAFELGTYFMHE